MTIRNRALAAVQQGAGMFFRGSVDGCQKIPSIVQTVFSHAKSNTLDVKFCRILRGMPMETRQEKL